MLLELDFTGETPIYAQIRNQIVRSIAGGELNQGDKLPTVRALADEAGINMMTVSKAYQLLKSEGYIETDRRLGAVIKGRGVKSGLSTRSQEELSLIAAEARLAGLSEQEFTAICKKAYTEGI